MFLGIFLEPSFTVHGIFKNIQSHTSKLYQKYLIRTYKELSGESFLEVLFNASKKAYKYGKVGVFNTIGKLVELKPKVKKLRSSMLTKDIKINQST